MVRVDKTNLYNAKTINALQVQKNNYKNSIWETNINGEIEDTKQGGTGDCWLLTHLNCLRDTVWGKKMIKNAIKSDGNGGATITFKGAKTSIKEFHISAEEIVKARESGKYSNGDDDVIAMELAVEKYLKIYRNQPDKQAGEAIDGNGLNIAEFVELLSGEKSNLYFVLLPESNNYAEAERLHNEKLRMLEEIEKHPGEYAVTVGFQGDSLDGVMIGRHAYQLQKVVTKNGQKYVVLVNPHNSSEKIEMEIEKFILYSSEFIIADRPGSKRNNYLKSDDERQSDFIRLLPSVLESLANINDVGDIQDSEYDKFKDLSELVDENNIKDLFVYKNVIYLLITVCDRLKSGWGNGKEKKALIAPFVDAYCKYAKKCNVPEDIIKDVKTSCYKELDAMFYTNQKIIIEKLELLFDEIEKAKSNNPLLKKLKELNVKFSK